MEGPAPGLTSGANSNAEQGHFPRPTNVHDVYNFSDETKPAHSQPHDTTFTCADDSVATMVRDWFWKFSLAHAGSANPVAGSVCKHCRSTKMFQGQKMLWWPSLICVTKLSLHHFWNWCEQRKIALFMRTALQVVGQRQRRGNVLCPACPRNDSHDL